MSKCKHDDHSKLGGGVIRCEDCGAIAFFHPVRGYPEWSSPRIVAEADELRAEVERLRAELRQSRANLLALCRQAGLAAEQLAAQPEPQTNERR